MLTLCSLWFRPYWDLVEYHVTLRYEDGPGVEPIHVVKTGTLDAGTDTTAEAILLHLSAVLVQQCAMKQAPWDVLGG
jgi:hypothetical protein